MSMETEVRKRRKPVKIAKEAPKKKRRFDWNKFAMKKGTYAELVPDPFNLEL